MSLHTYVIERELGLDVQVGVACFPSDAVCVDTLIAAADRASRRNRSRASGSRASESSITLIATGRSCFRSRAR